MKNNNYEKIINKYNPAKIYNDEIYAKTKKYQKIYGFEIGTGEHDAWNNEADAFKHTFMQADLAIKSTLGISKFAGDWHEAQGDRQNHQDPREKNMDLWNNDIGRKIAEEIKNKYDLATRISMINSGKMDDIIAEKVMQRMKKGDIITHLNDPRKYDTRTHGQKFSDQLRAEFHEKVRRRNEKVFGKSKSANSGKSSGSGGGRWVTIDGHHVYFE